MFQFTPLIFFFSSFIVDRRNPGKRRPRLTADRRASGECLDGEHEASDCKPSDERHRVAVEHRGDDRAAECRGAEVARPSLVDKW